MPSMVKAQVYRYGLATGRRWGRPLAVVIILLDLAASFIPAAPFIIAGGMLPSLLTPPITAGLSAIGAPAFVTSLVCDVGGCGHSCKGCSAHCGAGAGLAGMPVFRALTGP